MSAQIRAAQYVRMSTDHQRYSIDNQLAAIKAFAERHEYRLVRTYADEGRSGLDLAGRPGLQALLCDVCYRARPYDVLIVYDVSRWGRFQDIDEGAYYEHLCKRAGLRVVYCGEPFENDGTPLSNVIKALKRIMAAEYSRELSDRVAVGQYRTVLRGHHRGGRPGIGIGRVLVDDEGHVRTRLKPGQQKLLKTDRVILDRGPDAEVELVGRIFEMFVHDKLSEEKIAGVLNAEGNKTPRGFIWREKAIRQILQSERNIGTKIHGRIGGRLKSTVPASASPDVPSARHRRHARPPSDPFADTWQAEPRHRQSSSGRTYDQGI
jgi:DNA invertase Pin-like site-specific DNA recombinase